MLEFSAKYDDRETLNMLSEDVLDPELRERINHLAFNYGLAVGTLDRVRETMKAANDALDQANAWVEAACKAHPNIDIDIENLE